MTKTYCYLHKCQHFSTCKDAITDKVREDAKKLGEVPKRRMYISECYVEVKK